MMRASHALGEDPAAVHAKTTAVNSCAQQMRAISELLHFQLHGGDRITHSLAVAVAPVISTTGKCTRRWHPLDGIGIGIGSGSD